MITSKRKLLLARKRRFVDRSAKNFTQSKEETSNIRVEEIPNKVKEMPYVNKVTEVETSEPALSIELESVLATDGFSKKTKMWKKNKKSKILNVFEATGSKEVEHSSAKKKKLRRGKDRKRILSAKTPDVSDDAVSTQKEHFPLTNKSAKKRKIRRSLSPTEVEHSEIKTAPEAGIRDEQVKEHSTVTVEFQKKRKLEKSKKNKVNSNSDKLSMDSEEETPAVIHVAPLKTSGFCWNADPKLLAEIIEPKNVSESSDDEDENVSKKKKKRQTVAEKREAAKKEEERLREVEESLASNSTLPSSCDEFDRALLSKPDSSELWLQYMAFHLQATEIEKARAVAQRALKTISYRKEQEKFNIWVGLLNLENLYGTQESLKKTLSEALQLNDAYKVRVQMINIYAENGKLQELESEIKLVAKKFRDVKGMWLEIGSILYKYSHIEHARRLLQQSLSAQRNKNETVSLISRFALMEAKFGDMERALALFDSILASNPQRVDVWGICVDQLCKAGMIEQARSTLDRAISQKLKSRWMKILFAKYLSFEEKYGSPEGSERVREKAREYVEKVSESILDN